MTELKEVLAERTETHGDFRQQFACAQELKRVFGQWEADIHPVHREILDQIAHKLSRILTGNPNFADHWVDIAGYATCGSKLAGELSDGVQYIPR